MTGSEAHAVSAGTSGWTPDRDWFARSGLEVARDLLGALVTRRAPEGDVTVRITEVEAYQGERDPGSHAYRGRTDRKSTRLNSSHWE